MKINRKSRLQLSIQKFVFIILLTSSIGMLAWISNHYTRQFDLTANQRHSLSSNSKELLQILKDDISVHAYATDDITRQAIKEIISRYQQVKNNFRLKLLNPDIDIVQAQQDGIVMNKPFAFVIYYNNRMEHITSLSEQAITNALLKLNRRGNQQVVFIRGHGERDIDGDNNRSYSTLKSQLESMGFNLLSVNMLESAIPDNTRVLVIASPDKPYLEGEIKKVSDYIESGGNFLWLADPGELQGLKPLAISLGIQMQDGVIVDNNTELRQTLKIDHPAIIPVTEYFPHAITNTIRYNSLFPLARGISPLTHENTVNNWQAAALFNSMGKSWTEVNGLSDEMVFSSADGDIAGPITIAVILQRSVTNNSKTIAQRGSVIGDSDFLSDTYIGAGANLNLGLNLFNWLLGDDELISIETQPSPDTRLELDDNQIILISFGFLIIIPGILLITGFGIWHFRRKR